MVSFIEFGYGLREISSSQYYHPVDQFEYSISGYSEAFHGYLVFFSNHVRGIHLRYGVPPPHFSGGRAHDDPMRTYFWFCVCVHNVTMSLCSQCLAPSCYCPRGLKRPLRRRLPRALLCTSLWHDSSGAMSDAPAPTLGSVVLRAHAAACLTSRVLSLAVLRAVLCMLRARAREVVIDPHATGSRVLFV